MKNYSNTEPINSIVYYYFKKYIPNILNILLTNRNINNVEFWKIKDEKINKYNNSIPIGSLKKTNFFDIIFMAENENLSMKCFLVQIDSMFGEIYASLAPNFKKKLRNMFEGKIFNLYDLNYLSPIGELFFLLKFHFNSISKVLDIECKLNEGMPTFDFLIEINKNKQLVEIYNVHPSIDKIDYLDDIGEKILNKWNYKTNNLNINNNNILLTPIIWFTEIELSENNDSIKQYFKLFKEKFKRQIFGPLSIYKINYGNMYVFKIDFLSNHLNELEKQLN